MPVPSLPFAISIRYTRDHLDVFVEGSLDAVGGARLRMTLEHVVGEGASSVTLDLADVDHMDASGGRAVAFLASQVEAAGPRMTVRDASAHVQHVLHASAFDQLIDFTNAQETAGAPDELSELERGLAREVNPFAVADAALRLVTSLAQATVAGADGVSVSLRRHGGFVTVAASDDRIAQMDRDQYATGQGPCLAAATTGLPVRVDQLARETRWPEFVPRALRGGISSILSSPLLAPTGPVGALNMYSRKERGFGRTSRELAALFAEQASGILVEAIDRSTSPDGATRLQEALRSRSTIAQAQGILMARSGLSAELAYARLKLDARRLERSVREVSEETVASATDDTTDSSSDE